jgi:hypothetical protein
MYQALYWYYIKSTSPTLVDERRSLLSADRHCTNSKWLCVTITVGGAKSVAQFFAVVFIHTATIFLFLICESNGNKPTQSVRLRSVAWIWVCASAARFIGLRRNAIVGWDQWHCKVTPQISYLSSSCAFPLGCREYRGIFPWDKPNGTNICSLSPKYAFYSVMFIHRNL